MRKLLLSVVVGLTMLASTVQADYLRIRGVATGSGVNRANTVVLPSAYDNQRKGKHIPLLLDHERSLESAVGFVTGLFNMGNREEFEAVIPLTKDSAPIIEKILNGVLRNISIGFRSKTPEEGEMSLPLITELDLMEISIVTVPMDPEAVIFEAKLIKE